MSKYQKPVAPLARQAQPAPLTDEQKKEQALRAAAQKFNSLVEGIIFNAVQGAGADLTPEVGENIFNAAKHTAGLYLEELLGVKLTKKEEKK